MHKITFPLKEGLRGPAVVDLQDTLQLCLDRAAILANDEGARRELSAALKHEHVEQMYGDAASKLVSIFQRERRLEPSGEVDEATPDRFRKQAQDGVDGLSVSSKQGNDWILELWYNYEFTSR